MRSRTVHGEPNDIVCGNSPPGVRYFMVATVTQFAATIWERSRFLILLADDAVRNCMKHPSLFCFTS